jgi:hypothetical protein
VALPGRAPAGHPRRRGWVRRAAGGWLGFPGRGVGGRDVGRGDERKRKKREGNDR